MKKRLLALAMTGLVVFSVPVLTMAEEDAQTEALQEDEILVLDDTMIDEEVYEGSWITAIGKFDLYLPDNWSIFKNSGLEEEPEDDIYFYSANKEQTQNVIITYTLEEGADLETLAAGLEMTGFEDIANVKINDIPAVTYSLYQDEVSLTGIVAFDDQGGCYNIALAAPSDDEEFLGIAHNIFCSIKATESAE